MLIEDLKVIVKVAETASITAAAIQLDMRTATASAAVKRVEKTLGQELFIRTTRKLKLSKAGEQYLPECRQALQILTSAKQNIQSSANVITGELRIALSSDLGRNLIIPWLDDFMEQHPAVSLRTTISDSLSDFYRDPIDMALRYGPPSDSNLYGFKICDIPVILCASPEYLQQNGTPITPTELKQHNGLFYQLFDITHDTWEFTDNQQRYRIKMQGNRTSNDGDLVRRWCEAGKGIAIKSSLDMSRALLTKKVVQLLPEFSLPSSELWLVFPSQTSITPAARQLRDFLKKRTHQRLSELTEKEFIKTKSPL